ncbi:hypothetical protein CHS0354_017622 [Potamilus streckersoni]|uniref:Ig-like domain-containing protein n=1 Tax=Potamilus streckersoni TaxID=2493646 RepID=A0AAE0VHE1_9BIVA|nr:hypothetical protein CHS0354_017622 [Potamilus streckersoni]
MSTLVLKMAEVENESESYSRFDDVDVESILARVERRGPLTLARKRCLCQAPEFVKRLSGEETVDEGTTVKFECKVLGFPIPTLTWYKNDEVIDNDNKIQIEGTEYGNYCITINDVTKRDEGTYKCRAANTEGSSTSTIYLGVKAKSKSPKKSHHTRNVSFPPFFPPIIEKVEEEEKEAFESDLQPESPLTHLYDSICIRPPKNLPAFLGEWAFVEAGPRRGEEDLEIEDEDVFEPEFECYRYKSRQLGHKQSGGQAQKTLFFVSSCAHDQNTKENCPQQGTKESVPQESLHEINQQNQLNNERKSVAERARSNKVFEDICNGNIPTKLTKMNELLDFTVLTHTLGENSVNDSKQLSQNLESEDINRNLGSTTHYQLQKQTETSSTDDMQTSLASYRSTTSHLQNNDTPDLLMTRSTQSWQDQFAPVVNLEPSNNAGLSSLNAVDANSEDQWLELVLLISGSTFLALYFDVSPASYILDVILAVIIRAALKLIFSEDL